jgi:nucleoside-diphosphate-sugar epimerase
VTGAAGNAGQVVCRELATAGWDVRMADVMPPPAAYADCGEFVRCDTRTPGDVRQAVEGCDAVVHLAAWHCAHVPPVSDATIFAVNVDGTYNVLEACREAKVKGVVYASSMAYGWGSVYSVTKVIGEDLCRMYHETTKTPVAMLRYHDFVPKSYLAFGAKLLRNGVDRRDVATATVASLKAAVEGSLGLFLTIVHTDHGMPSEVIADFQAHGLEWCEAQVPGSVRLLQKYGISLPERVEQHDLSEAAAHIGWRPAVNFCSFLEDLKRRDAAGEDVEKLWTPSDLSVVAG